jgi:ABC-type sugar transport system substrate-binding protein
MTRSVVLGMAGMATSVALIAGCGGSGTEVTRAAGGGVSLADLKAAPASSTGAKRVSIVLPAGLDPRHLLWDEAARREAATSGVVFSSTTQSEGEGLSDTIRRAIRQGGAALLVIPGAEEDLGPVLAEARDRGVAVLTLLDPVAVEGDPVPAVVRGDLGPASKELVAAVVEDAPKLGKSASGPALVTFVPDFMESEARANALFRAAEEAGLSLIGEKPMALPTDELTGGTMIAEVRDENPGLSIVLAADDPSFSAAIAARNLGTEEQRFGIAGFVVNATLLELVRSNFASAAAFVDDQVIGSFAVRNALALIDGGQVEDRIVTPLPLRRAPGDPAPIPEDLDTEVELMGRMPGGSGPMPVSPSPEP